MWHRGNETSADMTAGQHIDYDALQLDALRGVVKGCLTQVARSGLLGDHHFYIAFNTQAANVGMSKRLKEKYPVEMTIVLQHRFWDLSVDEDRFEVKLTFDGIPERLVIPFKAVKVFYDPSVPYGLQFEESDPSSSSDAARSATRRAVGLPREGDAPGQTGGSDAEVGVQRDQDEMRPSQDISIDRRRGGRKSRSDKSEPRVVDSEGAPVPARPEQQVPLRQPAAVTTAPSTAKPAIVAVAKVEDADANGAADAGGAKIFDLSKFRGKK